MNKKNSHFWLSLPPEGSQGGADSVQLGASDTYGMPIGANLQGLIFAFADFRFFPMFACLAEAEG
jgi:hypothetical protein